MINEKNEDIDWQSLSSEEIKQQLFFKQKNMLEMFLEHRAITQEQFDKSLHYLTEKMGMRDITIALNTLSIDSVRNHRVFSYALIASGNGRGGCFFYMQRIIF